MRMKFIVERIEEDIASLENFKTGEIINFDISKIPFEVFEGDVLIFENECWKKEEKDKIEMKERIKNKMQSLWE